MCAILCIILRLKVVRKAVKYFFTVSFFIGLFTVIFRSVVYKIEQNVISLSWGGVDTNAIEQIQWHFYLSVLMGQVLDYNCRNKWTTLWAKLHIWCFLMLGMKKLPICNLWKGYLISLMIRYNSLCKCTFSLQSIQSPLTWKPPIWNFWPKVKICGRPWNPQPGGNMKKLKKMRRVKVASLLKKLQLLQMANNMIFLFSFPMTHFFRDHSHRKTCVVET